VCLGHHLLNEASEFYLTGACEASVFIISSTVFAKVTILALRDYIMSLETDICSELFAS
jgi:hypothetical protein